MIKNKEDTGVSNPYALAEIILGRRINWKKISNKSRLLESIFGIPFNEIIHPNSGSPIFYAFKQAWNLVIEEKQNALKSREIFKNDFELSKHLDDLKRIGDLKHIFDLQNINEIPVNQLEVIDVDKIKIEIKLPSLYPNIHRTMHVSSKLLSMISFHENMVHQGDSDDDWEPLNGYWGGSGSFFNEAAEYSDPIQGVAGDCYLIAALASVAWSRPFDISHRTRATGENQSEFVNMIEFHDENDSTTKVEVTSAIPISNTTNSPIYSRSNESNEIWPAIVEKAYAKWCTEHVGDKPNIAQLAGGSAFKAIQHLTGLQEWHNPTSDHSSDELWDLVRENSLSKRTFNPMAASTTSEKLINEEGETYIGTGIVPGHAYSILGWDYKNGLKYIILRNPWGCQEPNIGKQSANVSLYDISWWRNIELTSDDGVFGIEANVFKTYFSYIGGGKESQ